MALAAKFDTAGIGFDVGVFDRDSQALTLSLADGITFADSKTTVAEFYRTLSDGVTFSDSFDRVWDAYRTYTEVAVFSEAGTAYSPSRGTGNLWTAPLWNRDMANTSQLFVSETSTTTIWTDDVSAGGIWTDSASATVPSWSKDTAKATTWS